MKLKKKDEKMSSKDKLETSTLTPWRKSILTMVKENIKKFKLRIQPKQTKSRTYSKVLEE